ncbi:Hypothetical protein FKW44_021907 [Caligus rogercresseyi]|uniref:Uncharacterized protein n=1 Tax=Caligus rogercresseyi TaxID=217165 RepID=A0A7T8GS12_CALRO|nr:Hypothetical protein FKW44_021907 [Caligus rogercresseyi]
MAESVSAQRGAPLGLRCVLEVGPCSPDHAKRHKAWMGKSASITERDGVQTN